MSYQCAEHNWKKNEPCESCLLAIRCKRIETLEAELFAERRAREEAERKLIAGEQVWLETERARMRLQGERDALAAQVETLRGALERAMSALSEVIRTKRSDGWGNAVHEAKLAYVEVENALSITPDAALAAHDARVRAEAFERKYHEILLAVERKFPGESRHDTALRYIREAEKNSDCADCAAAERGKGEA